MDRLISEKQVIDTIKAWATPLQISNTESIQDLWVEDVCRLIQALPSAEPQKGYWLVDESDNSLTCTKCECTFYDNDITDGEANYCPNCGVKMEGMTWID